MTERQTDRGTERQKYNQTHRQDDREAETQTDRQINKRKTHTHRQAENRKPDSLNTLDRNVSLHKHEPRQARDHKKRASK